MVQAPSRHVQKQTLESLCEECEIIAQSMQEISTHLGDAALIFVVSSTITAHRHQGLDRSRHSLLKRRARSLRPEISKAHTSVLTRLYNMTRYGCPACNGTWEETDDAIAHCFDSRRNEEVFRCPCGQYRNCNLSDFIANHMETCNAGNAVLEGGLFFTNRGCRQNVILHCSRRKSVDPTYPMEIEEEGEKEEPSNSMPRVLAQPRSLLSVSSSSRTLPAAVSAPRASMPTSSGPSASSVTLTSLGLPPPGPVLSSLLGQDAIHTDFEGFFSNVTAPPSRIASSNSDNRPNGELEPPADITPTSPAVLDSARKGLIPQSVSEPADTTTGQQPEDRSQVNVPAIPSIIVDPTNDDDAPAAVAATVNASTFSHLERSPQVSATASRRRRLDSRSPAGSAASAQDGRLTTGQSIRGTSGSGQAARASRNAASGIPVSTMPTAEQLANAMPPSRYGPLGVPRRVNKKKGN